MSVNVLGHAQLRRLRRLAQDPLIDHAWVQSHHLSGRFAHFVTSDHRHGVWDRATGDLEWLDDTEVDHWASCRRFDTAASR